jgi:hypothetical protein
VGRLYAVVEPSGEVTDVVSSVEQAVQAAGRVAPYVTVEEGAAEAELGDLDAVSMDDFPKAALKASGLPSMRIEDVMKISLEDAYREVIDFWPVERKHGKRDVIKAYQTAEGLIDTLLGQNYKTAKDDPRGPSEVQGLTLLPHRLVHYTSSRVGQRVPSDVNLCVGASKACRASCLVYSGHNTAVLTNLCVKLAKTEALLLRPHHFCRLLVERIEWHATKRSDYKPYVRLNVFSDIPWEEVLPGLFTKFPRLQFYDYTKVPGRRPPKNYDLTFSYSGTNMKRVEYEIGRRRRIAVVFLHPPNLKRLTAEKRPPMYGLPKKLWDLRVIDGDVSDVRPRDPAPVVVGLRWKTPKGQDVRTLEQTSFVIPVEEVEGVLITSQAARHEPIVDEEYDLPSCA